MLGNRGESRGLTWHANLCTLGKLSPVKTLLKYPIKRLVLLGDSNTCLLANALKTYLGCRTGAVLNGPHHSCQLGKHLRYRESETWKPPAIGREGPTLRGLHQPRCSDCGSCFSQWLRCTSTFTLEHVVVEFARDVELQSDRFRTTQENTVDYLNRTGPPEVVVFNTGLHDLTYFNAKRYGDNLRWYSAMLKTAFPRAKLLFINTGHVIERRVPPRFKKVTNNAAIHAYNDQARVVMQSLGITFINNWVLSAKKYSVGHFRMGYDGVHFNDLYYEWMCRFVHAQLDLWYG